MSENLPATTESLDQKSALEVISAMEGHKLSWKEYNKEFQGTILEVDVKENEKKEPDYLQIQVHVPDLARTDTIGTAMDGFHAERDTSTGDLHVTFNPYGPVKNLVIEGNR
jgi:hypothetical protein